MTEPTPCEVEAERVFLAACARVSGELGLRWDDWVDWPAEVADPARLPAFLDALRGRSDPDERRALSELVVFSLDDWLGGRADMPAELEARVRAVLRKIVRRYPDLVGLMGDDAPCVPWLRAARQ